MEEKRELLLEIDDAIFRVKKKIADYEVAIVKGKKILEELDARKVRLLNDEDIEPFEVEIIK